MRPNLFDYATSELSQDAFLAWLAAWADPRFSDDSPELNRLARSFLAALFEAGGEKLPDDYDRVQVKRQVAGLDLLIEVGDTHVVGIEDKVDTRQHSDQLKTYREMLEEEFPNRATALIYLKTGDQSNYSSVREKGWSTFLRRDLLEVLKEGTEMSDNVILLDFMEHLRNIESAVQAFRSLSPDQWHDRAWAGFFMALQEELGEGQWGRVPNPSGGFMGFWWNFQSISGGQVYLQLEEEQLVCKVQVDAKADRKDIRNRWSRLVIDSLDHPSFRRPSRFGSGRWMTVAVGGEYLELDSHGLLALEPTTDLLTNATHQLKALVERVEKTTAG